MHRQPSRLFFPVFRPESWSDDIDYRLASGLAEMVTVESFSYPEVTEAVLLKEDYVFLKDMNQLREYNMNHISFLQQQMRGKRAEIEQWMTVQGIRHQQQMHQWMTVQGIRHQQQMICMRTYMQQQMRAELQQQDVRHRADMRAEMRQQDVLHMQQMRAEMQQQDVLHMQQMRAELQQQDVLHMQQIIAMRTNMQQQMFEICSKMRADMRAEMQQQDVRHQQQMREYSAEL